MGVKWLGKIKIHEIAKLLGLGSKEVVAKAQELGIPVWDEKTFLEKLNRKEL